MVCMHAVTKLSGDGDELEDAERVVGKAVQILEKKYNNRSPLKPLVRNLEILLLQDESAQGLHPVDIDQIHLVEGPLAELVFKR
jgi:hypothetical protein